jgi:hypothetical protein
MTYSLQMLGARSIVFNLSLVYALLPRSSCKPRTTFQLLQGPFRLELLLLHGSHSI